MSIGTNLDGVSQLGSWSFSLASAIPAGANAIGSVSVSNFPATQSVSGTVAVSNFPATQPVSGNVGITGSVAVTGTFFQSVQPVSGSLQLTGVQIVQQDDGQYDDDGYRYVNPNVPGADIATGDRQNAILLAVQGGTTAIQTLQSGLSAVLGTPMQQSGGSVAVNNFPINQTLSVIATITPNSTPILVQDDDKQYDDDGIPYVNPNVQGADIATGDRQNQILAAVQANQPRTVSGTVAISSLPSVATVPALPPNAALESAGQIQRMADLLEAILVEMRVLSTLVSQQSQPVVDDAEKLRGDLNLVIN